MRAIAHFLKTQSALLPADDRIMAIVCYKKLNKFLWKSKESTSQYEKERIEITDIVTDIQKALLLVHNKTPIMDGYNSKGEATVRDEVISALSSLVTAEDKDGYHQKVADIFLDVVKNRDKERWNTVQSAIIGLWPFLSETNILIELFSQSVASEKITYDDLSTSESAAVALKNQAIYLPGRLNEHRNKIEEILNSAYQEYLKKEQVLKKDLIKNENRLKYIEIIYLCLNRCLEEIEQIKIQEEKAKYNLKKSEDKEIKIQHPVKIFIDKEALAFISLLIEDKEGFVEHFLNDPRHIEMHISYVKRCIEIISNTDDEKSELKLWLDNHPIKKREMLSFFKKMQDDLNRRLKHKLICSYVPKKIKQGVLIAKCPVCGMDVDEEKRGQGVRYKGVIYYFCCDHCQTVFEKEPARYHQIL